MFPVPPRALVRLTAAALLSAALAPRASGGGDRPDAQAFKLHGVLSGCLLRPEPYFQWKPNEKARAGVLGTVEGTTREFENIVLEICADRSLLTAGLRAAYEAYVVKRTIAAGAPQVADVKADGSIVRVKGLAQSGVYVCATRQVGRTVVYVRGNAELKDEAALAKIVKAFAGDITCAGDDVDGWLPPEIKATWTRVPVPDLLVQDDGGVDPAVRDAIVKVVRDAHALVKRLVPGSFVTPPVLRITKSRDMLGYLSGRKELRSVDAVYAPAVAELIASPRSPTIDVSQIAQEAAGQALHHLIGAADAEPLLSGVRRYAGAALAEGGTAGALLASGEELALSRVKARTAKPWYATLRMSSLVGYLGEDAEERAIDAELIVGYLASSSATAGKASLAAWVTAFRKTGHPDAAAEAGVVADSGKSDAEYWAYWEAKADPSKKPGKKPGK